MQKLPADKYSLLYNVDKMELFPTIMAVVYRTQSGTVFVDDIENPKDFFVIHKCARAYFYSTRPSPDYNGLLDFIYNNDEIPGYIHIYNPPVPLITAAQEKPNINIRLRDRMRMRRTAATDVSGNVDMKGFTAKRIDDVDSKDLDVFNINFTELFWDSMEDLMATGIGWVIYDEGKPMTLWFAVSVANKNCETDINTLPEYRGKGAAGIGAALMMKTLEEKGVTMDWDLFTDNTPSLKLAERFKYEVYFEYKFLSIFKVKS